MKPSAEGFFLDSKNRKIHVVGWWAHFEPKATIVIVHGLGDHAGRYSRFANNVNARGFHVVALDLPGFGRSEGKKGHIQQFSEYLEVVEKAAYYFKEPEFQNLPAFLFGHSLGGLIAFHVVARKPSLFNGAVLASPAFAITVDIPKAKFLAAKVAGSIMPGFTLPHGLPVKFLSHDPKVIEEYEKDPLVHDRISARLFFEVMRAMKQAPDLAKKIQIPVLVQVGGDDPLVDIGTVRKVFDAIPHEDKELLVYDHFYHELYNERDRAVVFDDLERWILKHL